MSYTLVLEWMPGDLYMSAVTARCTAPTSSYSVVWLPPNKVYQITLYCGSTSLVSFLVGAFRGKAWSYMSFGKMNTFISIVEKQFTQDDEGFKTETDVTVAEVRAYREGRHGSEKWANMASFSTATDLFQFRVIPGVTVTTDMRILCDGHTFEITSVEDVKGRGMYLEVLVQEVR